MLDVLIRAAQGPNALRPQTTAASRRGFLGGASALGALAPPFAPALAASDDPIVSEFVTFPSPEEEFKAHFRFSRDFVDQGEALSWYHFMIYAVADGVRPAPVVRMEGTEWSYFRRIAPLTWRIHAHNLSYPRDLATGAFTDTAVNPVTGETVNVPPTVLTEDPGVLDSPAGYVPLDSKDGLPMKTYSMFRREANLVKQDHVRAAPANWPVTFIESSTSWVEAETFDNPAVTSLPYGTSGFYVFPFPKWMNMGDRKGHMVGFWSGRKLASSAQLPRAFRAKAEEKHGDLLQSLWAALDTPIPQHLMP